MSDESAHFWGHIRRHVLVISTMERDVRLSFIAGLTVVVLAIALNIFRDNLGPPVHFALGTIPLGALWAVAAGEFMVLFLLSLAVLLLKGRWRYLARATMLIAVLMYIWASGFDVLSVALAVPVAMLWAFAFLSDRHNWGRRGHALGALTVSVAAILIMIFYAAMGRELLIVGVLGFQGLAAMFGLWMAATDIAEMALVAVESVTTGSRIYLRDSRAALAFAIIAIVANILLSFATTDWSPESIAQSLGAGAGLAIWLGLIYWMVISRRKQLGVIPTQIDYGMLLVTVGIYFVALQAGVFWQFLSDPLNYHANDLFKYPRVFAATTLVTLFFIAPFLVVGRRSAKLFTFLAFGITVGFFIFHYYSSQGRNVVLMLDAVAMGSLLLLIFARLSRKMRDQYGAVCLIIADLNLAFVAYALLVLLFFSMKGPGGTLSVGQALIVLAALGWDVVFSGEAITNRHSEMFPRLARVAVFLAYISSVALLVMVSTASEIIDPFTGQPVEGIFESEPMVAVGLILFGAPFIFLIATLRIRNLLAE